MIKEVEVQSGGQTLSRYTGEYFSFLAHKDNKNQLDLWKQMIGDSPLLNHPEIVYGNRYPNAVYQLGEVGTINVEPSIHGRKLYIPLDLWFCKSPSDALPLIATQYAPITIRIRLRPLQELYLVRDRETSRLGRPNYSIF